MFEALTDRLEEGIYQIVGFLPRLAAALGILMVGLAIAKMVERGTDIALHRIGFDRWMREGGVTEALERAGTTLDPSSVAAKLVFWTVMLLVILLAANALGIAAVSVLFAELLAYIPSVITAVIVLVIGILLGEFVKDLVSPRPAACPAASTWPVLPRARSSCSPSSWPLSSSTSRRTSCWSSSSRWSVRLHWRRASPSGWAARTWPGR
jgi:hypothetical protein